ncbi:MAG: type II secretion system inner membrane protein GspF [Deltaproteobacteria bacterium]|nr:type II secretion system inner membrane protein GspF [Deltaproteobacteria bacterium]
MPVFEYKGFDDKGSAVKGLREADSPKSLRTQLRKDGIYLTEAFVENDKRRGGKIKSALDRDVDVSRFIPERISIQDVAVATRQLATLTNAGIPLVEALTALVDQVENRSLKRIYSTVKQKVNEGISLADALAEHRKVFSNLFINMVRAGESSGALDVVLFRLADFTEGQSRLRSKILGTMVYPIIMVIVGLGILAILFAVVIPRITLIFKNANAQLPIPTRILIFSSEIVSNYWWLLLALILAGVFLGRRYLKTPSGRMRFDQLSLRAPIFGPIVRMLAIARFSRTLATLLSSGVPLLTALDIVKNIVTNVVLGKAIDDVREAVREGASIADPLRRSKQFPPIVVHMVAIGERSGALEPMLLKIAESYEQQTEMRVGMLTTLLEPLMILLMGGGVGFVVMSILMPILQLNQFVGR